MAFWPDNFLIPEVSSRGGAVSAPAFDPASISDLTHNFDASALAGVDDSTLTNWTDLVASDAATASGTPKLRTSVRRGRNVVRFAASESFALDTPPAGTVETICAIIRQSSSDLRAFLGTSASNWLGTNPSVDPQLLYTQVAAGLDAYPGRVDGGFNILIWRRNGTTRSVMLNGVEISRSSSGVGSDSFTFDGIGGFSPYQWSGDIAQIIRYSRSITDEERTSLHNGMFAKWGVTASIICDGNSLVAGLGVTSAQAWPGQLQTALGANYSVLNLGISDRTTATQLSDIPTKVARKKEAASNYVYVYWEGTNSIYYGASAEDTIDDLKAIGADQKADGKYVIILTVMPRDNGSEPGDFETKRTAVNTEIRNAANIGVSWDAVVDVAANANLQDPLNLTYFSDGVHLTPAGYAIVEGLVRPVVLAAL